MPLDHLLPAAISGWSSQGKDESFDRKTIFHYMNGAGEIYLAYDFQEMLVREYKKESAPSIVVELYQMSSSEDAFGVFSFDTDGEAINMGQGAIYAGGLLRFWKDRIFVRLLAEYETDESKAAIISLGKSISGKIPYEGKTPLLLSCLPFDKTSSKSFKDIHYFHKPVILNSLYYISDSNLLNLNEDTEAVLARYQSGHDKLHVLLVRYQKPPEARAAYEQFVKAYFPENSETDSPMKIEEVENGRFVSARRIRNFVIIIFESSDKGTCDKLTNTIIKELRKVFLWMGKKKVG